MVEYVLSLNSVFGSLADATRRDILRRVAGCELSVNDIAAEYDVSLAAISKHLKVLEKARLIIKRRKGKEQMVRIAPQAFSGAEEYLDWYHQHLEQRYDRLETFLDKDMP